jgi:hypothetical protein
MYLTICVILIHDIPLRDVPTICVILIHYIQLIDVPDHMCHLNP